MHWGFLISVFLSILGVLSYIVFSRFSRDVAGVARGFFILCALSTLLMVPIKYLFFGITAGLCQLLADLILVKKTLSYTKTKWRILSTPWWMTILWIVAFTHLVYWWKFVRVFHESVVFILVIYFLSANVYFYSFEILAGNIAVWWKRRNCWQPFGVALYATLSEAMTVGLIPVLVYLTGVGFVSGLLSGIVTAIVFIALSFLFERKECK